MSQATAAGARMCQGTFCVRLERKDDGDDNRLCRSYHISNADNGYTVLVLVCEEEEITCVGIFSGISEGENIEVTGEYTAHPTYGKQFKAESYVEKEPTDELSIERYLGSGAIKGIGAALAARIVRRFKGDTFRIIEEEPERLAEVKGISERKAMEISDQVSEKRDLRQAMIFLQAVWHYTESCGENL